MSPEERKLLEEALEVSKENNEILRGMRRTMRVTRIMSMLYWIFIIGSAFGAYYFLQPYVDQVREVYTGAGDVFNNFKEISQ